VALAGPTWQRQSTPAFRSDEALVVVLDLSRSMDATDVKPSRMARARLKLLDLLKERDRGQTALVVFTAHAFTVTPLTTDNETVANLVVSLGTDIMPSQGSYPEVGLEKAATLLEQAGIRHGQVLLITDSQVHPTTLATAASLNSAGHQLNVLGVGTPDGGPILNSGGGFLTDATGQVVVARLDETGLRRLAVAGGGRYATMGVNRDDLSYLAAAGSIGDVMDRQGEETFETALWQDQGAWLALLLVPLAALAFRRGWLLAVAAIWFLPVQPSQALQWQDLWLRRDQQALRAFQAEQVEVAAELFEDPQWQAVAKYRAGDFPASAAALAGLDDAEAQYNRGNALARAGSFPEAVAAYDRALQMNPDHADAAYNRQLLLENMPPPPSGEEGQQSPPDAGEQGDGEQQQSQGEQQPGEGEEQAGEQGEESEGEGDSEQQSADAQQAEGEDAEAMSEWASDQAADQWLRRIPDDPGGLLRRKFRYQYQRLGRDQDGNDVWPGDEEQPW
jgi:Ca-activated chloride channel family protein